MHLAEHFTVVHSCQLLIGKTPIDEGKIADRTKYVHQKILLDTELKVQLTKMKFKMDHPEYSYPMENGGFTAWLAEDCCQKN